MQEEEQIKQEFIAKNGCEVNELTPEELEAFKEKVKPLVEKYKAIYGPQACAAWGVK